MSRCIDDSVDNGLTKKTYFLCLTVAIVQMELSQKEDTSKLKLFGEHNFHVDIIPTFFLLSNIKYIKYTLQRLIMI